MELNYVKHYINIIDMVFKISVTNSYNNHIGSIADYDPIIKQQSYGGVKYTNNSETRNYNYGVSICYLLH